MIKNENHLPIEELTQKLKEIQEAKQKNLPTWYFDPIIQCMIDYNSTNVASSRSTVTEISLKKRGSQQRSK